MEQGIEVRLTPESDFAGLENGITDVSIKIAASSRRFRTAGGAGKPYSIPSGQNRTVSHGMGKLAGMPVGGRERKHRRLTRDNGYGAGKGASLWGAFEMVFLSCNKFKETRFQRLKACTHCLANEQTYIVRQSRRKAAFLVTERTLYIIATSD